MNLKPNMPWLNIIGVTEYRKTSLTPETNELVEKAQTIIGPKRLLDALPKTDAKQIAWQTPLSQMIEQVRTYRGSPTLVLATGDPNWFGIGVTLSRYFEVDEFVLHPAPSAFQLAAARLHWPLQNCKTVSLHGRAVENLHPHILPSSRILALTSDASTLQAVAQILLSRGYGQSQMSVLENMGSDTERLISFPASNAEEHKIGDFYVLAIDCVAGENAPLLPCIPGLPDEAFVSDGQLTKRDVRATTLAKLAPHPNALLWDIGAGCGSIGIEWMRSATNAKAICFERQTNRCGMIARNKDVLGVPSLQIVMGELPETLNGQPQPDAIFIGGDIDNDHLFEACWAALKTGGRLVANAVTIEGGQALVARQDLHGGGLTRIDISVNDQIGTQRVMRPRMSVTQWDVIKGHAK